MPEDAPGASVKEVVPATREATPSAIEAPVAQGAAEPPAVAAERLPFAEHINPGVAAENAGAAEKASPEAATRAEAATPKADPGRSAAQQVAVALNMASDGRIDLALDPEELGPVRLSLAPGDGVVIVHLAAERAETLDLLRRHADDLARELRQAGYGTVDLRFETGTGRDGEPSRHAYTNPSRDEAVSSRSSDPQTDHKPIPHSRSGAGAAGGLDLRL